MVSFKVLVTTMYAFLHVLLYLFPVLLNILVVIQNFKQLIVDLFSKVFTSLFICYHSMMESVDNVGM